MNQPISGAGRVARITADNEEFTSGFPDNVYDPLTRVYYAPVPSKELFPGVEKMHALGIDGRRITTAILDTGLMLSHPRIKPRVIKSVDFTGEGPDDRNGHGTAVAFVLLATAPATRIVNVKCFQQSGYATEFDLERALRWCMGRGIMTINLSGGVFDASCRGDCKLCQLAIDVAESGPYLAVAAGNLPDQPLCPGKAGFRSNKILVVAAYDKEMGRIAPYSAKGELSGNVGLWQLVPVE